MVEAENGQMNGLECRESPDISWLQMRSWYMKR